MWVMNGEPNSLTDKIEIHSKLIAMAKLKFILKGSLFSSFFSFFFLILYSMAKSMNVLCNVIPNPSPFTWFVGIWRLFAVTSIGEGHCWNAKIPNSNGKEKKVAAEEKKRKEEKNYSKIQIHWNCGRFMYSGVFKLFGMWFISSVW